MTEQATRHISALFEQALDHIWSHFVPSLMMCLTACLTMCLAYLILPAVLPCLSSEMSILQLASSMLTCCLFFHPALAVWGRRLLASRISCHLDAVLSLFVSQCAGPRFLMDEPRVPVCIGSNCVSFQHTTLLWDGRKCSELVFFFFLSFPLDAIFEDRPINSHVKIKL